MIGGEGEGGSEGEREKKAYLEMFNGPYTHLIDIDRHLLDQNLCNREDLAAAMGVSGQDPPSKDLIQEPHLLVPFVVPLERGATHSSERQKSRIRLREQPDRFCGWRQGWQVREAGHDGVFEDVAEARAAQQGGSGDPE